MGIILYVKHKANLATLKTCFYSKHINKHTNTGRQQDTSTATNDTMLINMGINKKHLNEIYDRSMHK